MDYRLPAVVADRSIDTLEMSIYTLALLRRHGIETLGDLLALNPQSLRWKRGIGPATERRVRLAVQVMLERLPPDEQPIVTERPFH